MNKHTPLILLVVLVWIYLLVQSVAKETRQETHGTGTEVWELGKGYRAATAEETAYDIERGKWR